MSVETMITWEEAVEQLRRDPDQQELVRFCYYDDPLKAAAERFAGSEEWDAVRELLPAPGKVLEIGAGRGISSFAFAKEGWEVTALEPDPSEIVGAGAIRALAGDAGVSINVVENWGESLPFPDGTFDMVYGRAVFHHARHLDSFCSEAFRVLRPGGCILLTREHVLTHEDDLNQFLESHPLHHLYGGECAYTLDRYLLAITRGGFTVREVIGPMSSPVNYFPETTESVVALLKAKRRKRLGRLRNLFGGWSADICREEALLWEEEMKWPGRLYSFLARRKNE